MSAPTGAELLERIRRVYASCRTYRDRGRVTTVYLPDGPGHRKDTDLQPFATAFAKPARLRFEFEDSELEDKTLLLGDERGVRSSWSTRSRVERHASLREALGTFAGVSGGSSTLVPSLLLPVEKLRDPLPVAESTTMLCMEQQAGHECFVLRGTCSSGHSRTLWVGNADLLIRRVAENHVFDQEGWEREQARMKDELAGRLSAEDRRWREDALVQPFHPFRTEQVISYEPELDVDLQDELFAPPAGWGAWPSDG